MSFPEQAAAAPAVCILYEELLFIKEVNCSCFKECVCVLSFDVAFVLIIQMIDLSRAL